MYLVTCVPKPVLKTKNNHTPGALPLASQCQHRTCFYVQVNLGSSTPSSFLPVCQIFSQSERPYVHCFAMRKYAVSGPSVTLLSIKCTLYYCTYSYLVRVHSPMSLFLPWSIQCTSVVMMCFPLLYAIVDTDGNPSASPGVEVASVLC